MIKLNVMMNIKNVNKYQELHEEFYNECVRVCAEFGRYNKKFLCLENFEIDGNKIECSGRDWYTSDRYDVYTESIPVEWLTMSDSKFKKYVDELIAEEEAKDLEIKKRYEEKQRARDLEEYNRLKEKLGL